MGEALLAQLGGAANIGGLRGAVAYGARSRGSVSALARETGIPRSTLRGWAAGRSPRGSAGRAFTDTMRGEARADALAEGGFSDVSGLTITGRYTYSGRRGKGDDRDRVVQLGDYLTRSTGDRLVEAYLDGADAEELQEILSDGLNDDFYRETFHPGADSNHTWDVHSISGWG